MRYLLGLLLILTLAAGGAYVVAGRTGGPSIEIAKPEKFVGAATPLEVTVGAPENFSGFAISIEGPPVRPATT